MVVVEGVGSRSSGKSCQQMSKYHHSKQFKKSGDVSVPGQEAKETPGQQP